MLSLVLYAVNIDALLKVSLEFKYAKDDPRMCEEVPTRMMLIRKIIWYYYRDIACIIARARFIIMGSHSSNLPSYQTSDPLVVSCPLRHQSNINQARMGSSGIIFIIRRIVKFAWAGHDYLLVF